ncbi:carboxypeptidase-like regulatory domain-containing protein [Lewinella sp. JB7]|uniref:carboxypeptidase-like regulatory domain-containing protein n=1 Tax=Lewinella sp. JB7 TaxID=2962887 RepID=UPI0020C9DC1F|nr:carboxypeptidase-like regulatory domain-containing protein [Lewinella sp. JB7]MCP9237408.1 carboxypeptidase-like regulatory domain-containing protein [Lewinella sp. JB7]
MAGTVISCADGTPVPYPSVYLREGNRGVSGDSLGRFRLVYAPAAPPANFMVISSLGFATDTVSVRRFLSGDRSVICLTPAPAALPEVSLTGKRLRRLRTLGNRSESRTIVTGWSVDPRSGAERGTLIKAGKNPRLLKRVNIHLARSTYDSLRVRVNLYALHDKRPETEPLYAHYATVYLTEGWVGIPLGPDPLPLKDDVLLTLEIVEAWSKRDKNVLLLSAGLFTRGLYHREHRGQPWRRARTGLSMTVTVWE